MARFVFILIALSSCAALRPPPDKTVCPESRDLRCIAGSECSMDATRGCRVCQCASISEPMNGVQPDNRIPH